LGTIFLTPTDTGNSMNKLLKLLKQLQKQGYEQVTIQQVTQWISDIKRENLVKAIERKQNQS
jgi:hypothetical protein